MLPKYSPIFCILLIFVCLCAAKKPGDKVRLEKVQVLTLNSDQWTAGRRSAPIKQLTCVGGYCNKARVTTAQCYNRGFDGRDVAWECKAEMPGQYKFGRIEVICEGYDYPEDEYILVGSCGLEYTIEETGDQSSSYSDSKTYYTPKSPKDSGNLGIGPIIVIIALIAFIYFTCLRGANSDTSRSSTSSGDDYPRPSAPPPPGFRSDYTDYGDSCSGGTSARGSSSTSGPGFYSGMAAGGLMGYLFGNRNNSSTYSRPYGSSSYYGPSTSGTSSSSGGGSSGSGTHTSSGFGSTRRR